MSQYIQDPALWGLVVAVPAAATAITRLRRQVTAERQKYEELRLGKEELESHYTRLETDYLQAVEEAKERAEESTKSTLKSAMRTLQGLAGEQQVAISRLQQKYGDTRLLQDLLGIDHMNSQFTRRTQSIAVLAGGWPGRQRTPATLHDVVRSAKGRIRDFTRVEIRSQTGIAVVSRAVEPVALALAELLDNATSYSAPDETIEINIRTVPKGVCIIVDDAGVGMNEEEKAKATALLSGERSPSVSGLGNPPQFGFAVIGHLAAHYGFSVTVDSTSPYGGVRAVVLLPDELLTAAPEPEGKPAQIVDSEALPDEPAPSLTAAQDAQEAEAARTAGGLPKRRRKRAMSLVPADEPATGGPETPARSSEAIASVMGALQQGTRAGRRSTGASSEGLETQ